MAYAFEVTEPVTLTLSADDIKMIYAWYDAASWESKAYWDDAKEFFAKLGITEDIP